MSLQPRQYRPQIDEFLQPRSFRFVGSNIVFQLTNATFKIDDFSRISCIFDIIFTFTRFFRTTTQDSIHNRSLWLDKLLHFLFHLNKDQFLDRSVHIDGLDLGFCSHLLWSPKLRKKVFRFDHDLFTAFQYINVLVQLIQLLIFFFSRFDELIKGDFQFFQCSFELNSFLPKIDVLLLDLFFFGLYFLQLSNTFFSFCFPVGQFVPEFLVVGFDGHFLNSFDYFYFLDNPSFLVVEFLQQDIVLPPQLCFCLVVLFVPYFQLDDGVLHIKDLIFKLFCLGGVALMLIAEFLFESIGELRVEIFEIGRVHVCLCLWQFLRAITLELQAYRL